VGSGCGSCADMAESILNEANAQRAEPALYSPSHA